jgi:hypothetical protein
MDGVDTSYSYDTPFPKPQSGFHYLCLLYSCIFMYITVFP